MTKSSFNYPPRGFRSGQAAAYLGMSRSKFLELVDEGRLPRPRVVDAMRIWDRVELDTAFDEFAEHGDEGRPNSFDRALGDQ
jgi:excisionase family DNA binding protein